MLDRQQVLPQILKSSNILLIILLQILPNHHMQIPYPSFFLPRSSAHSARPLKNPGRRAILEIKIQRKFGYVLGAVLGRKSGQHGSNLAPKMEPKSAKNREKIDAKIDRKIDAFQDRFLMRFWWILGAKLEPSWDPNRRKMKVNFESPIFQKTLFFLRKNKVF